MIEMVFSQNVNAQSSTKVEEINVEKIWIPINGIDQGMFIRSTDTTKPILLFIHGGPCFSTYFMVEKYQLQLEKYFTVCYWEERGGGLSYNKNIPIETMNFEQLIKDALAVTDYLRSRFKQDKIYILGHSGGTPIGLGAITQAPHLYHAFISIAQLTNQYESEKIAYQYITEKYNEKNNKRMVKKLKKFLDEEGNLDVISFFKSSERDFSMHDLGIGTALNMNSVMKDIFIPVWKCNAYTFKEKFNFWYAKFKFLPKTNLRNEVINTDFSLKYDTLQVPIYFFSGKYDLTVNYNLSYDYFLKVNAPIKEFYLFENSAHSPMFEEPERFLEIIKNDVCPL